MRVGNRYWFVIFIYFWVFYSLDGRDGNVGVIVQSCFYDFIKIIYIKIIMKLEFVYFYTFW